jgi:5-formyltetrahydrofolate cyclo-ligase
MSQTILAYKSFGSEFDTAEFIRDVLTSGKILALPKVHREKKVLDIYRVQYPGTELQAGMWGIPEPNPDKCKPIAIKNVDFVLVPGLAFDASGQRLGYGRGYYDKLLEGRNKNAHMIAAAYSLQIVDAVPTLSHDIKVGKVITEY